MPPMQHDDWTTDAVKRVYVAGNVREAGRVETSLEELGVVYSVCADRYAVFPFLGSYDGVSFHVHENDVERTVAALVDAGLVDGLYNGSWEYSSGTE